MVAVALLLASGCSPVGGIEAARLLFDVAFVDDTGAAEPVPRSTIAYQGDETVRRADVYAPDDVEAVLVLVPGAAERAMDDPRLINFADAFRRRGFLALVPESAGDGPLQVSARDADAVADAVRHLLASGQPRPIGIAALSYAVGPAVQAALREDIRGEIDFVVAVGGYHDVVAAITYITTGAFREDPSDPWSFAEVDRRAKWIFLRANAGRVGDPRDAARLAGIARARLRGRQEDPDAVVARLGPEARAVHDLVANRDPDRVAGLVRALPASLREEIRALDLSTLDLADLEADLILIHGRNDPLVPYTESLRLAEIAGPEQSRLYLLEDLQHVDIGFPGAEDFATLLSAAYRLLAYREPPPGTSGEDRSGAVRSGPPD